LSLLLVEDATEIGNLVRGQLGIAEKVSQERGGFPLEYSF
jgi:hypothetical protein